MTRSTTATTERTAATEATEATAALGAWASQLRWDEVPASITERLRTALFDILAANLVGARTPAQRSWRTAWPIPAGHSPVVGGGTSTDPVTATWLNAPATVCLELDEGNKYAQGHPAAHTFPAVLALAAELDSTGDELASALLAGYEVAARFGTATSLRAGTHPHGNWGVPGAAAGCARLLRLDPERTAAAIDTGAGMPVAGHFAAALDGNPVRDAWLGAANTAGIAAARLAEAGTARNTGSAATTLGDLLGEFDATELVSDLGRRFDVGANYFKQHSSCSYTHPIADLLVDTRQRLFGPRAAVDDVARQVHRVEVRTHALAAVLARPRWHNSLSAMFSTPFVAATALLYGEVTPEHTGASPEEAPLVAALAERVRVIEDPELTRRLPDHRAARVTVHTGDAAAGHAAVRHTTEADNPIGDVDYQPFDRADLTAIFTRLLGGDREALNPVEAVADGLATTRRARELLGPLSTTP